MKTSALASMMAALLLRWCDDAPPPGGANGGGSDPAPAPTAAPAPSAPSTGEIAIASVSSGGSGCPSPGMANAVLGADGQTIVVTFDAPGLSHPPGPPFQHSNCAAGITLRIPPGWAASVTSITTRGAASLPPGTSASRFTGAFFAGSPEGPTFRSNLGPGDGPYTFTDTLPTGGEIPSVCGRDSLLTVNAGLSLEAGDTTESASIQTKIVEVTLALSPC